MIVQKLKRTTRYLDPRVPKEILIPVNPDGFEAANYIENMIHHMGHVIRLALEHADEATIETIKQHAHAAIKGDQ